MFRFAVSYLTSTFSFKLDCRFAKMHPGTELVKSYLLGPDVQNLSKELERRFQLQRNLVLELDHYLRYKCTVRTNRVCVQLVKIAEEINRLEDCAQELEDLDANIELIRHRSQQ